MNHHAISKNHSTLFIYYNELLSILQERSKPRSLAKMKPLIRMEAKRMNNAMSKSFYAFVLVGILAVFTDSLRF